MASSLALCDKIQSSDMDEEDIEYLRQSWYSLFPGAKLDDVNKSNCGDHQHHESSLCSSFEHNWCTNRSGGNVRSNFNNFEAKCSDDSDSGYKSVFSPISLKEHPDSKVLFNDLLDKGIDTEDLNYLQRSFNCLLWDANERYWTNKVYWDFHPTTSDDSKRMVCSKTNNSFVLNKSGSARTEGFHKVNKLSRLKVDSIHEQLGASQTIRHCGTPYSKSYRGNKQTLSRDARNDQRRLFTAYQTITGSDLLKLNELKFRKKKLRLGKSEIHGLGLFASEPISPNEIIIEYVGQIIRPVIADLREKNYKLSGIGSYCFKIDDDTIVDATKHGNLNRYINHSCNPNSYAKILLINNQKKIVIYSKKSIKVDEEITYDYKMPFEDDKIMCLCRAPGCRKFLN